MLEKHPVEMLRFIQASLLAALAMVLLLLILHIPFYTTAVEVYEGQKLAGASLMKSMELQQTLHEAQRMAVQTAQEETRTVEEARARAAQEEQAAQKEQEIQSVQAEMAALSHDETAVRTSAGISHTLSAQDYRVLQRIVQAEAGGCDMKGRILVANVVLNRVESEEFPDNVTDVVYQKSQFSPVSDGSLDRCTVSEETVEAVDRALSGEDYSQGALYFMNRSASYSRNVRWFDGKLTYLFQHGGHEFFR
jgi:spore germination cell wall hydrolase CwlJ-like protein